MQRYNSMPDNAIEINKYEDFKEYFTYSVDSEFRQPHYNNNFIEGSFDIRIYWIDKNLGLGYGIADDWKNKRVVFYKFGTEEKWNKFKHGFAEQFKGDNS